ncbi:hypothetical protein Psi02_67210 [Planotetraspora silvatica]|uniref:Methylated-DNA-[protein]-cysteine S-methyltransferase DNA binding domain-containing protein n=2 Tax=Planotetraspora silvatica TaxID=234614 RepID=A0A8J3US41_9ACTN|nr:hypothetical protein Psi02_67210 [Planotetraspora silvatica]
MERKRFLPNLEEPAAPAAEPAETGRCAAVLKVISRFRRAGRFQDVTMPPFEPIVTVYGPMVLPVVPCHRVVRSDGSLGGYAGGNHAEHALLTLEATP